MSNEIPFHVDLYSEMLQNAIQMCNQSHKKSYITSSVKVCGVTYKADMLVPLEAEYELLTLGRIVAALVDDQKSVHFLLCQLKGHYVHGMGMYKLSETSQEMVCISYKCLLDHAILPQYEIKG